MAEACTAVKVERHSKRALELIELKWVLHGVRPSQYASAITDVIGVRYCNQKFWFLYTEIIVGLAARGGL